MVIVKYEQLGRGDNICMKFHLYLLKSSNKRIVSLSISEIAYQVWYYTEIPFAMDCISLSWKERANSRSLK